MFLTRSSLIKTIVFASILLILGAFFYIIAYMISKGDVDPTPTVTLATIITCFAVLITVVSIYADSISKPLSEAERLVKKDLTPKKYISIYKEKSEGKICVIARPRFDMLELLYIAYDLLEDKKGRRAALDEMKAKMKPKYKAKIAVYAADEEYKEGRIEEGDKLLDFASKHDESSTVYAMAETVKKTSRAEASGDTETEKNYYSGILSASGLFKADNAAQLKAHWRLYSICFDEGKEDEANEHLLFCAKHGGSTAISRSAKSLL